MLFVVRILRNSAVHCGKARGFSVNLVVHIKWLVRSVLVFWTMPSAARTSLLGMIGSLNDDELERMRKESNVA